MKHQFILCSIGFFLWATLTAQADDHRSVFKNHLAWKTAAETTDILAVDAILSHKPDVIVISVFGRKTTGWPKVRKVIKRNFDLVGQTQLTVSNLVITVSRDRASATMDYRWSALPKFQFKGTEYHRLEDGRWKIYALDSTGKLPPLKADLEVQIRPLVQKIQRAISGNDIDKLQPLVTNNGFTYVAFDGKVHHGFSKAIISPDLAIIQKVHLDVVYLQNEVATAHLTVTLDENNEHSALFVIKNLQLTNIDFAPKPLSIDPKRKRGPTVWGRIKAERPD
jgi:ketosteroid isomerase-like protein